MLRGYLELVRPANVTTAFADVLAGFAVAGLGNVRALPWLLAGSACLYAGGVVLNDFFDRGLDAIERPERPLPSGRVPARHAAILGGALLALGVALAGQTTGAALAVAGAIAACVVLYDAWGKHYPIVGPVNMGLCRGLNLLLGVAAVPAALMTSWPVALTSFAYIVGVTALSRGEVTGGRAANGVAALVLLGASLTGLVVLAVNSETGRLAALALTLVLGWRVFPPFWEAYRQPAPGPIRKAVKTGRCLVSIVGCRDRGRVRRDALQPRARGRGALAGWLARSFAVT